MGFLLFVMLYAFDDHFLHTLWYDVLVLCHAQHKISKHLLLERYASQLVLLLIFHTFTFQRPKPNLLAILVIYRLKYQPPFNFFYLSTFKLYLIIFISLFHKYTYYQYYSYILKLHLSLRLQEHEGSEFILKIKKYKYNQIKS